MPWRKEAAGAPRLRAFLKTFFVPAGNTTSALMFTMFRQVKIQLISLPEADQIRIACCQIAPGSKFSAFSGPTRSISCPWIVNASAGGPALNSFYALCNSRVLRYKRLRPFFSFGSQYLCVPAIYPCSPLTEVPLGAGFSRRLYYCDP